MSRNLEMFDEGIVLSSAMRVAAGQVVHRDFYSVYGPGSYYVVAWLFDLFPARFFVARLFGIAILAGVTTLVVAILLDRVRLRFTSLAGLSCVFLLSASNAYLYPLFPCVFLTLAGAWLLVRDDAMRSRALPYLAGMCTGALVYFRYDVALYALLSNLVAMVVVSRLQPGAAVTWRPIATRAIARYGLGTAVVFLPGFVAFLYFGSPAAFMADIVEYGTKYYVAMRGLPFPRASQVRASFEQADIYVPFAAMLCVLIELRVSLPAYATAACGSRWRTRALIVFGLLAAGMFVKGYVRKSPLHSIGSVVPSLIVLALCVDEWWKRSRGFLSATAFVGTFAIAVPALGAIQKQGRLFAADPAISFGGWIVERAASASAATGDEPRCPQPPSLWAARLTSDYLVVGNFLRAYSAPDEEVFVGLDRHDKIFINPLSLYFIADRRPSTHWHEFDPGLQTRADIQSAMVEELQTKHVRWVVRDATYSDVHEPNGSRYSSGVHVMDDFLNERFREVARAGKVAVWLRDGVDAPTLSVGRTAACMPVAADAPR